MDTVTVRARDCSCPGTPHEDGDTVTILARPSLALGLAAQADIIAAAGDGSTLAQRWMVTYIRLGAVGWNLTDGEGLPVPFDVQVLLDDYAFAVDVADKADDLYSQAILRPLTARLNGISQTGRTTASTSPRVQSIRKRRERSSPASTAATARSMP